MSDPRRNARTIRAPTHFAPDIAAITQLIADGYFRAFVPEFALAAPRAG